MDKKPKKEDKKSEKTTVNKGESLLSKIMKDLDIIDFIKDRGDFKAQGKKFRYHYPEKSVTDKYHGTSTEKKKNEEDPAKIAVKKEKYVTDNSEPEKKRENEANKQRCEDVKALTNTVDELLEPLLNKTGDEKGNVDNVVKPRSGTLSSVKAKVCDKTEITNKTYLDYEGRKRLRERYTIKLRDDRDTKKQADDEACRLYTNEPSKEIDQTEPLQKNKKSKEPQVQRKPIIKTIRLSNDNRVYRDYKAITFIDQKESTPVQIKIPDDCKKDKKTTEQNESTPLQIKIPTDCTDKESAETNTDRNKLKLIQSKGSVQVKPVKKKKEKPRSSKKSRPYSPLIITDQNTPQTEVAKWAPSSISRHNKPYYEAWVDTTLAAINRCSETDNAKLFNKNIIQTFNKNIIQTFKRALEVQQRPGSPDLVYEKSNDEKYTGKIIVRQGGRLC